MIYFVQAEAGGPIKIGVTVRLTERLNALTFEAKRPLKVLAILDGDRQTERSLHKRFADLRQTGEWFAPAESLLEFIRTEGKEWDGSDERPAVAITMVCRSEYKDWVLKYAKDKRTTPAQLIDQALVAMARHDGIALPPIR